MIISISGKPGSGKSTVAKKIAEKLNYERYYMGGLRRQAAREKGMTLAEYNRLGEKDFSTDKEVDEYLKKLGQKEDNFIIEGRTAFHFIPHSYKIFLDVEAEEGARRIFKDIKKGGAQRNEAKNLESLEDVLKANQERMRSDDFRYKKYYDLDIFNPKHYDLYLDTTNLSQKNEFKKVFEAVKRTINKQ
ncbi:MAG: cytidylate kinase family protein [Patescibacteria group bacterium]|nr:cytidylate kinase family protein [Patescibacteria group bacterium]